MITPKLVSVIIPVYNAAGTLLEAVLSVLEQTYKGFEVILVMDRGSVDESTKVVSDIGYLIRGPVRCYFVDHMTAAEARNYGADQSAGEFLLFLDADDKLDAEYLCKTVLAMQLGSDLNVGVVSTDMRYFGTANDYVRQKLSTPSSNDMPITSLVRREAFDSVKGFDKTMLWDDWDLWLRIIKAGWKVSFIHESLFLRRIGINDLSSRVVKQGGADEQIRGRHA
jgi:glycosyltransferase involved in cell wall biosynthesis